MNVWDKAKEMHVEAGFSYDEMLSYYQERGWIISGPEALLWGDVLLDDKGEPAAWFVYLGIGSLKELILMMPFYLPKVGFYRMLKNKDNISFYNTDNLARKIGVKIQ